MGIMPHSLPSWRRGTSDGLAARGQSGPAGTTAVGYCMGVALEHFPATAFALTPKPYIEASPADAEADRGEVGKPCRQCGVDKKPLIGSIRLKAKDHLQKSEGRSSRPALGHIGAEILNWKVRWLTLNAGIEFRYLMPRKIAGRASNVTCNSRCLLGKTIASKPHRNDAVVMRPHGPILVRMGIVGRMIGRQSADAPAGPHVRLHQAANDAPRPIGR